ncbi:GTPase HflX [Bulleidia sp. zg-1006]|uniref:GTPase HflX n=1 Tax=Bulleidia sp. zg-1006 TaxID=2806552 RepID=UPI00193A657C|nr:GTPase HflX [Bulleidia sp. zg-1006]QRG87086.1 GTPase HflX [Bulleidia sp. zg-1006]
MKRCYVVGVERKGNNDQEIIQECVSLCEACNYEVVQTFIQKLQSRDSKTVFRSGKIMELKKLIQADEIVTIVFYHEISVSASKRLSEELEVEVLDRTAVILDIFAQRARSKQAKIQTELARLSYALPKELASLEQESDRQRGGGVITRGSGEQRSEMIVRKYAHRKHVLQEELKLVEKQRQQDEKRRAKTLYPRVALVGYTNAGKSSLLNAILAYTKQNGKPVVVRDRVFETLDTSVRLVEYKGFAFYLYDTVGFVSDLPKPLVDAFYSTLESAKQADILIHVVDGSDPLAFVKEEATKLSLKKIGAHPKHHLLVRTKKDLMAQQEEGLWVSSHTQAGIKELLDQLIRLLYPKNVQFTCLLPYDKMALFDQLSSLVHLQIISQEEEGLVIDVAGDGDYLKPLRHYEIKRKDAAK